MSVISILELSHLSFVLSSRDDGYHIPDWFRGGMETIERADNLPADEAEALLTETYLGADTDGIEVTWSYLE